MQPLGRDVIRQLDLRAAATAEGAAQRNLVPEEPGWDRIAAASKEVAHDCEQQLMRGYLPAAEVEMAARKPSHGVRPIPYWGVRERVIYRALSDAALKTHPPLDRSPEAYLTFVKAPIRRAFERQEEANPSGGLAVFTLLDPWAFDESSIGYIVKADIAAFYQFIDHAVLGQELILQGARHDIVAALLELLQEVQGRRYGLPQLFDPSDALSEVYAARLERRLLRAGLAAWRFNDDFRVACDTYADALDAIEQVDRAARQSGLVLNDSKTVTVRFGNYALDVLNMKSAAVGRTISVEEVDTVVGDYTDEFASGGGVERARTTLTKAQPSPPEDEEAIDLANATVDQVRLIRRALNGLAQASDASAVTHVPRLASYVPSLMPALVRYLLGVGTTDSQAAASGVDRLWRALSANDWQRAWIIEAMRELDLLRVPNGEADTPADTDTRAERTAWVQGVRAAADARSPLRAIATRALASAGYLSVRDVLGAIEHDEDGLYTTYVTAAAEAWGNNSLDNEAKRQIASLASSSVLGKVLVGSLESP